MSGRPGQRRARKRFGQHFLEAAWVDRLIRAIDPRADETFLEIGPGRGALTRPLAARAARVIAVEIDRDLAAELKASAPANLRVLEGDILDLSADDIRRLAAGSVRIVGNLPYNVASPILFKIVEWHAAGIEIRDATVMLQREVADRLVARPGTGEYGVLSVRVGQWASVTRLLQLPAGAFRPVPKVRSTVVRLSFHSPDPRPIHQANFEALVQAIFTRRRKTLENALLAFEKWGRESFSESQSPGSRGKQRRPRREARATKWGRESFSAALRQAGIDGRRRPETLEIRELVQLSDALSGLPQEG